MGFFGKLFGFGSWDDPDVAPKHHSKDWSVDRHGNMGWPTTTWSEKSTDYNSNMGYGYERLGGDWGAHGEGDKPGWFW